MDFWQTFAAVMFANVLTAMFLFGVVTYTRMEHQARAHEADRLTIISIFLPLAFLLGGLLVAFGWAV